MQSKFLLALILLQILSFSQADVDLNLFNLTQYPGAQCLDGSAAGVYTQKGFGTGINKYVIYFEGGGVCLGPTKELIFMACYDRSHTPFGSSKLWTKSRKGRAMMSDDKNVNIYYNWNKIYIPYCDGSCHQGYLNGTPTVLGRDLYFRGYNITVQSFNFIFNNFAIQNASQIVLSGASAGGLGVYYWTNYLGERLNPKTKYMAIPDSGFFINYPENGLFMKCIREFAELNEPSLFMPSNCPYADKAGERFKCLMPQYFVNRIKHPIMIVQSEYDLFQIIVALGIVCEKGVSFQNCDSQQMAKVNDYRNTLYTLVQQAINSPNAQFYKWGIWMPACAMHTWTVTSRLYTSQNYQVPMDSGHTLQNSITQWMDSLDEPESQRILYYDNVTWPNNAPCSGEKNITEFVKELIWQNREQSNEENEIDTYSFLNQQYMIRTEE